MPAAPSSLPVGRVRELVRRSPVTCRTDLSAAQIARRMSAERVGSVIVVDDAGAPIGIVTDRDLRRKVVAESCPASMAAADIMSRPVVAIHPDAFAFEAVLEMTRREIHHLALVDDGRLVGVISTHDFLVRETVQPVMVARAIGRATAVDALRQIASRVTDLVRQLVAGGAPAYDVGQLVAELNDRLVVRALAVSAIEREGGGEPPVPHCWLLFGSEARREQTLRTDQANGLVYADPPRDLRDATAKYYARLADLVIRNLVAIGVPRCPGESMASNPRWCQPLSTWTAYFRRWMEEPEPGPVLAASICFDVRPLDGTATELGDALRAVIRHEAPKHRLFLGLLARDVATHPLPLTLLGRIAFARSGPHRGAIDVKGAGGLQLVGAARIHALEVGLDERNTVGRFRAAADRGIYRAAEAREITDAYQHLTRLRLVHQLDRLARGETPDNWVPRDRLSRGDMLLFRDALGTVQRVQAGIRERFAAAVAG